MPAGLSGDLKGGGNHVYMSGPNPRADGIYLLYEWPAGGTGGSLGRDGNNTVRNYTEGDFNSLHAAEVVESAFPLRVERCEIREGSCGDGAYRGGFGLSRQVRVLDPTATLSVLSDKNVIPPYGVKGGLAGAANRFTVLRDGVLIEPSPVPGKVSGFALRAGDIVLSESAGGGGYGDPLTREPARVLADVRQGYITAGQAAERYGVVIADRAVAETATEDLRAGLRADRVRIELQAANQDAFDGPRRLFDLPATVAAKLGVAAGDMVELSSGRGAAIRGWYRPAPAGEGTVLVVGPSTLELLDTAPGEVVAVRAVRRTPNGTGDPAP